jgi:hypothetical protein
MYEPQPNGKMELIAVEYISFKGPASLGGQLFAFNGAPNRYGLDPFYDCTCGPGGRTLAALLRT